MDMRLPFWIPVTLSAPRYHRALTKPETARSDGDRGDDIMRSKEGREESPDELISHSHAEQIRIAKTFGNPERRRWIRIGRVNMYRNPDHSVEAYVLEGTPPRGYIIACYSDVLRISDGVIRPVFSKHLRSEADKCLCGSLPRKKGH
jgi:hypothetical protein